MLVARVRILSYIGGDASTEAEAGLDTGIAYKKDVAVQYTAVLAHTCIPASMRLEQRYVCTCGGFKLLVWQYHMACGYFTVCMCVLEHQQVQGTTVTVLCSHACMHRS